MRKKTYTIRSGYSRYGSTGLLQVTKAFFSYTEEILRTAEEHRVLSLCNSDVL